MAWITIEEARDMLHSWIEAERAVTTGQSYRIGSQSLTRADLSTIAKRIQYWKNECDRLESGRGQGARILRAVPRDF